jgi:hypothetical protein
MASEDSKAAPPIIPLQLLAKLERLRPDLSRYGCIQKNGKVWRLRIRSENVELGYRQHRSVVLGADERIVDAVRAQLQKWRDEVAVPDAQQPSKKEMTEDERNVAELRRQVVKAAGDGPAARRRSTHWFEKVQKDPKEIWRFCITGGLPQPKKVGRPRKAHWY